MEARFLKSKLDFKTTDGTISLVHADGKVSILQVTLKLYSN